MLLTELFRLALAAYDAVVVRVRKSRFRRVNEEVDRLEQEKFRNDS